MATSLLTLLDDVASLLDDIAAVTHVAARKTAGVVGDDLALNAQQVTGMRPDRELPVVWAVARGSLVNKAILVPVALAISAFLPGAILPLLMIGGAFLCYEGFEKVWHKLHTPAPADAAGRVARLQALADPAADPLALERAKVKGAVRTDFILSAEVIVIALGTMAAVPTTQRVVALTLIGVGMTVLVYGLVAGLVKLDDLGLHLHRTPGPDAAAAGRRRIGAAILRGAPVLMKSLSVLGTAAMFMVGGGIIAHGVPPVEHLVEAVVHPVAAASPALGAVASAVAGAVVGVVAGGLIVGGLALGQRARGR